MQYDEDRAIDNRFESRVACKISARRNINTLLPPSHGETGKNRITSCLPTIGELSPQRTEKFECGHLLARCGRVFHPEVT
jgi:hypothetical protein